MALETHGADLLIEEVSVTYPGAPGDALSDIGLHVAAGSVTAVLGPSGC